MILFSGNIGSDTSRLLLQFVAVNVSSLHIDP